MIITIARQYGSGGRKIGELLAQRLGYQYYDREILTMAAEKSSIHPDVAKRFDEKPASSLLYTAYMAGGGMDENIPLNQKLAIAQFDAIRSLSESGNCIFVGRCADMVLQKRTDLLRLFLHAPLEWRVQRAIKIYEVPEALAEKTVKKADKTRADYYEFFTQKKWGACNNYDLSINTSLLGIEGTVDQLAAMIESRK